MIKVNTVMDVATFVLFCFCQYVFIWMCLISGHGSAKLDLSCVQIKYLDESLVDSDILAIHDVINYNPTYPESQNHLLYIDPCTRLADSIMKIIMELPNRPVKTPNSRSHIVLCLKQFGTDALMTEELHCYNFTVADSPKKNEIHCDIAIPSYQNISFMQTFVTMHDAVGTNHYMYEETRTDNLDRLCGSTIIKGPEVRYIHGCGSRARFKVMRTDQVKAVIAKDAHNMTIYLTFESVEDGFTEFSLNPNMNGQYTLKIVVYRTDIHELSSFESMINVICHVDTMPPPTSATQSGGFLVFLLVMTLAVAVVVVIILTVIFMTSRYKQLRRDNENRRRSSVRFAVPLNNMEEAHHFLRGPNGVDVRNGGRPSYPSSIDLETLESRSTKDRQIMILPVSYDQYVRDLVQSLKELFSFKGNVICKCVFDSKTNAEYNRDKFAWIDSVLNNPDTIVLVLCFTSPCDRNRGRTCVDEILDECKQARLKPQCHLIFLNMTGREYELTIYHGEASIIQNRAHVEELLTKLFVLCGFNVTQDEQLLQDTLRSEFYQESINKLHL